MICGVTTKDVKLVINNVRWIHDRDTVGIYTIGSYLLAYQLETAIHVCTNTDVEWG